MEAIDFPKITLGGVEYTVKFSRAMIYRMGKAGVTFAPKFTGQQITMSFTDVVDVLRLAIGFEGTVDELAELVYDKRSDAVTALVTAWGKAFPPSQTVELREPAGVETPATKQ